MEYTDKYVALHYPDTENNIYCVMITRFKYNLIIYQFQPQAYKNLHLHLNECVKNSSKCEKQNKNLGMLLSKQLSAKGYIPAGPFLVCAS